MTGRNHDADALIAKGAPVLKARPVEIERSIIPRAGWEFVARIREDGFSPWRYIGCYPTHAEALDAYRTKHQELYGVTSPFFGTHHKPHPAIVAWCKGIEKAVGQ